MKKLIVLLLFLPCVLLGQDTTKGGFQLRKGVKYEPRLVSDTLWAETTNVATKMGQNADSAASAHNRITQQGNVSVLEFGATGEGVANDSLPFANAISYAISTGAKVIVPSGDYLLPYGIDIPSGVTIEGVGATKPVFLTTTDNVDLVRIYGDTSTVTNITSTSLKGATSLIVTSSSGFAIGDTVLIKSNGIGYGDGTSELGNLVTGAVRAADTNKTIITSAGHKFYAGEEVIVTSVGGIEALASWNGVYADSILSSSQVRITRKSNGTYTSGGLISSRHGNDDERNIISGISGTTITLKNPLYNNYHVGTYRIPTMQKINVPVNITFRNIIFRTTNQTSGAASNVKIQYGRNITFENCEFSASSSSGTPRGVYADYSDNVKLVDCKVESVEVRFEHSKFGGADNCKLNRATFTVWKNSDEVIFTNCTVTNTPTGQASFYMAQWSNNCEVIDCHITALNSSYFQLLADWGSDFTKFHHNTIKALNSDGGGFAISLTGGRGMQATNNTITGFPQAIELEAQRFSKTEGNTISYSDTSNPGNGVSLIVTDVSGGDTLSGNTIKNNTLMGNGTSWGLHILMLGSGRYHGNEISGNIIHNCGAGFDISEHDSSAGVGFDYNTITDNIVYDCADDYNMAFTARHNVAKNNQPLFSLFGASQGDTYTVASADTIAPLLWSDLMQITGTEDITYIMPGYHNKVITLKFDSALTIRETKNIRLNGDTLQTSIGAIVTLMFDDTYWVEVSRKIALVATPDLPSSYQQSGKIRTAVALTSVIESDGVNEYMNDASTSSATYFGAGTIAFWFNPLSSPATYKTIFIRNGDQGNGAQDTLASVILFTHERRIIVSHRGYDAVSPTDTGVISSVLDTNNFVHVAVTWNGSAQNIFINGVLDATSSSADTGSSGTTEPGNKAELFRANAQYAEMTFWDTDLDAAAISTYYLNRLVGDETNLHAYFTMGDTTHDATQVNLVDKTTNFAHPYQTIAGDSLPTFLRMTVGRFEGEVSLDYVSPNATVDTLVVLKKATSVPPDPSDTTAIATVGYVNNTASSVDTVRASYYADTLRGNSTGTGVVVRANAPTLTGKAIFDFTSSTYNTVVGLRIDKDWNGDAAYISTADGGDVSLRLGHTSASAGKPLYVQDFAAAPVLVTNLDASGVSGAVGIGTDTPVASAVVEVVSTTKGFLPPRMTAAQASAISSPAEGLMVYVTDTDGTFTSKGWWGYNGAAWEKLNN